MIASLVAVSLLAAEVDLTPAPMAPPLDLSAHTVVVEPEADRGTGFLKHGYGLASLGTSALVVGGVMLGLAMQPSGCSSSGRCFNETGPTLYLAGIIPLILGGSMLSIAIPLLVRGFRERFGT